MCGNFEEAYRECPKCGDEACDCHLACPKCNGWIDQCSCKEDALEIHREQNENIDQ